MIVRELFTTWDFNVDFKTLNKMDKKIGKIIDNTENVGKNFGRMSENVRNAGLKMTAFLTVPIALFGFATLRAAGNFEASMNRVGALTQSTGDEFDKLNERAKDLGATTQFTATQAADAMSFLAQAGLKTKDIYNAMPDALNLAGAAQIDFATTADIVTNVMSGMGIASENLGEVVDILTKTFISSNTDLSQLGEAMKFAAPVAKGFNLKLEETVAILGLMGNAGIQASLAGTSLRGALTRLSAPTGAIAKILSRLGVQTKDGAGGIRNLVDIMIDLEKAGATSSEIMQVFGLRAGPGMLSLLEKGTDSIKEFIKVLSESGGTAKEIQRRQLEGLNGAILALTSAFESLQLAIADSGLLKFSTKVIKNLTKFFRKLAKTSKEALNFVVVLLAIVAVFPPMLLGLGLMGLALKGVVTGFALAKTAMLAFRKASVRTILLWIAVPIAIAIGVALITAIFEDMFAFFIGGESVIGEIFKSLGASQTQVEEFGKLTSAVFGTLFDWAVTISEVITAILLVGFIAVFKSAKEFFKFLNGEDSSISDLLDDLGILGTLLKLVFQEPLKEVKEFFGWLNKIGKLAGGALFDLFGDSLLDKPNGQTVGAKLLESGLGSLDKVFVPPTVSKSVNTGGTIANSVNVEVNLKGDSSTEQVKDVLDATEKSVASALEKANRQAMNELQVVN